MAYETRNKEDEEAAIEDAGSFELEELGDDDAAEESTPLTNVRKEENHP